MREQVLKSFKFELRLNKWQKMQCTQIGGICRYMWNKCLELKIKEYEENKKKLSEFDLNNLLPGWKKELPWLCTAPAQSLQQVNTNLCQAFKNFFNGSGYPRFKKKGVRDSFRIPQGIKLLPQLSKKIGVVHVPKLKKVRFIKSREIEGKIKQVTISREADKWFISFTCEVEMDIVPQEEGYIVAGDRGVVILLYCSDGTIIEGSSPLKKCLDKLNKLLEEFARKQKGSENWIKLKRKIQKLYRHIANKRKDEIHKITTQLAKNHSIIVLEDLEVRNMTKSAKGTIENPGKNVRAKSGLNRSILDQAWHMLQRFLEYKMAWRGGTVAYVNPRYTSQRCSQCRHIAKENRKSQSQFVCVKCGYKAHADFNASKNILNEYLRAAGHAVLARGERTWVLSKQELETRKPITVTVTV